MLDQTLTLLEDPEELGSFTARLLAEVKAQAIVIEKLRHQLAGHRAHRFGAAEITLGRPGVTLGGVSIGGGQARPTRKGSLWRYKGINCNLSQKG